MSNKELSKQITEELIYELRNDFHTKIDYNMVEEDGSISTSFSNYGVRIQDRIENIVFNKLEENE